MCEMWLIFVIKNVVHWNPTESNLWIFKIKTIGTKQTKIEPVNGFSMLQISFIQQSMVSLPQVDNCEN